MLISEKYKELNAQLHGTGNYGVTSAKWADSVASLAAMSRSQSVLDYGCGQGHLGQVLAGKFDWRDYDPCIPGLDASPQPADLVVCTDVLEHIEPECLEEVLDDLQRVVRNVGFFVIATGPANKVLPDGRNAHLIQESARWWLPKLCQRFEIVSVTSFKGEFAVVVRKA
jgi:2-polyprenyl-3-methyl-5-hydroxy-6-metoxy-1,4-benzoquinol methylase